ncbi:MAG: chorismate synthase [Planctomycetota bacterium]|jgi:chorismate synthase
MKIVITGPKSSGKTTIGTALSERLSIPYLDLDDLVLEKAEKQGVEAKSCAVLYKKLGEKDFRLLERKAISELDQHGFMVLATGGSTLQNYESRHLLRPAALWVYLKADPECLWNRIPKDPLPAYLQESSDPHTEFIERVNCIDEVLSPRCDVHINTETDDKEAILDEIVESLHCELAVQASTPNTLGDIVRLTTFGESHGPMIGAVMDGVRPGLPLLEEDIQKDLDRRRPGQSAVATARKESDLVEIVSGVFEGKTTGTPVAMLIKNSDSRSSHYEAIKDIFRPGHADYTFWQKFGIRDYRGGGRSSGRETATRVAGGAIARKILAERGVTIRAYTTQIGDIKINKVDPDQIEQNPVRCPDKEAAEKMENLILQARKDGDSVGGIAQVEVRGLPAGLGDPVFSKIDARLASAIFSIGAVKGVEFGCGFEAASLKGSENNDPIKDGKFQSNNAGGILGGISSGQPITARIAVKPTPSISSEQQTIDTDGKNQSLNIEGRHDPCILPRIIPVIEAMTALTLLDAWEVQARLRPGWPDFVDNKE